MDSRLALISIDRLFAQAQVEQIAFSGGEPLLREDLELLIARAKSYGTEAVVTTNGTLLTPQRMARLIEAGADLFQIPVLSGQRDCHDYLSGRPSWDAAIAAITRLVETGHHVAPVFVATAINASQLNDVLRLCADIGIDRLIVNWFIPGGAGLANQGELQLDADRMVQTLLAADRTAGTLGVKIELGTPVPLSLEQSCLLTSTEVTSCPITLQQRHFTLDAAGSLKRCNHSPEVLGSLLKEGLDHLRQRQQPVAHSSLDSVQSCRFSCQG